MTLKKKCIYIFYVIVSTIYAKLVWLSMRKTAVRNVFLKVFQAIMIFLNPLEWFLLFQTSRITIVLIS